MDRNEALLALMADLHAQIDMLIAQMGERDKQIAELEARIAGYEAQLPKDADDLEE